MPNDPDPPVTKLLNDLAGGDASEAARRLWETYYVRLVGLARSRLPRARRTVVDEEDVALSAFHSLVHGAAAGRFPRIEDGDGLWRLLATITARKVADHLEREARRKRGGGRTIGEADLPAPYPGGPDGLARFADKTPTPEFLALTGEQVERLFGLLPDESLRLVALMKLEGHSNEQIASGLDCAQRTVERKLEQVRLHWKNEGPEGL